MFKTLLPTVVQLGRLKVSFFAAVPVAYFSSVCLVSAAKILDEVGPSVYQKCRMSARERLGGNAHITLFTAANSIFSCGHKELNQWVSSLMCPVNPLTTGQKSLLNPLTTALTPLSSSQVSQFLLGSFSFPCIPRLSTMCESQSTPSYELFVVFFQKTRRTGFYAHLPSATQ